jgi:hypothetical protein
LDNAGWQTRPAHAWTLTGASTALAPWRVVAGTLAISSDASLGCPTMA